MNIRSESTIPNNDTPGRLPAGMRPLGSQRRLRLALLALVIIGQLMIGGSRVSAQTETLNLAVNWVLLQKIFWPHSVVVMN
jgi:hypothetical protein